MKKGFTLVELLTIIAVIAVLALLTVPIVNRNIQSTSRRIYKTNESSLATAAENYYNENNELLPQGTDNKSFILLSDLVTNGYIKNIKSLKDKVTSCNGIVVVANKGNDVYDYKPYLECEDDYITEGYDAISIIGVVGANPMILNVGETYTELGAVAYSSVDGDISDNIQITTNDVNTDVIGTYSVVYEVIAGGRTETITRTVNVISTSYVKAGLIAEYKFDDFQEPTENYAQYPFNAYALYYTYSREGDTHICYRQSDSTSATVALSNPTFTAVATSGTIYTISGYLYLNGVPFKTTVPHISTYHTGTINKITRDDGYFEFTQPFVSSQWIIHSNLANAQIGDTIKIKNLQIEFKHFATPFTPDKRTGKVKDYSVHNSPASLDLQTTPSWISSGVIGGAYRFGLGTLNQIIAPMQTPISEKLTLCAWIYPTQYPTDKSTIIKGENPNGYYLSLSANGALASYWYNTSNPGYHLTSTGAVPLNDWSYVCTVWNGTNNKLYVNANPLQTIATTGAGISSTGIVIGAESTARQFKGNIDEVLIYNRNLNDTEILNNYLIGRQQLDQQ